MLWKAGAGFIFLCFSLTMLLKPLLFAGFTDSTRYILACIMMLYALFRFYGCYVEFKSYRDE